MKLVQTLLSSRKDRGSPLVVLQNILQACYDHCFQFPSGLAASQAVILFLGNAFFPPNQYATINIILNCHSADTTFYSSSKTYYRMNSNKRFSALLAASAAVVITIWACFQLYPPSMRWTASIHPIFQDDTEVEKISKNSLDTSNTPQNYAYATSACNINEVTVRNFI